MQISTFSGSEAYQSKVVVNTPEVTLESIGDVIQKTMWSPSTFVDNIRNVKSFKQTKLLVLDIDEGITIEAAKMLFARYRFVIGTTRNHGKEKVSGSGKIKPACDRFRLILELSESIDNVADYSATWASAQRLCPYIDSACRDVSRFYFGCVEIVAINSGAAYEVTRANPKPENKPAESKVGPSRLDSLIGSISAKLPKDDDLRNENDTQTKDGPRKRGKVSVRALQFLTTGEGQWHTERNNFVRECKQNLYTFEEMRALFEQFQTPDDTDLKQMDDIWNNREINHGPRIEGNDTYRAMAEILGKSRVIMDIADPDLTSVVNFDTMSVYDFHVRKIKMLIGNKEWPLFLENDVIHAHFIYKPHAKDILSRNEQGEFEYNCYVPPEWKRAYTMSGAPVPRVDELPDLYKRFFLHLVDNHTESFEYLLNWLSLSLTGRNLTFLTAIGEQGAGKGTLGEILQKLHGQRNFVKVRDGVFKERFNGPLKNKTLVYVDEVDLKTKEARDRIKDMVNDEIEIEEKGKDHKVYRNHASFYLSSNDFDAIKIEAGDRRFSIIQLTNKKLIDTDLIGVRDDLVSEENINLLARYLFSRNVNKHEMFVPFKSARYEEVREAGLKEWEIFVTESWCAENVGKRVPIRTLQDAIEMNELVSRAPGRPAIQALAKKYPEKLSVTKRGAEKTWYAEAL